MIMVLVNCISKRNQDSPSVHISQENLFPILITLFARSRGTSD